VVEAVIGFLTGGTPPAYVVAVAFIIVVLIVGGMYLVAFIQGRSVSFWPPQLGSWEATQPTRGDRAGPLPGTTPEWLRNSREVDERSHWTAASTLTIGVQYSPKFFKDFFDVIESRSKTGLATVALVLDPEGEATRYLKATHTGTAQVAEGVAEIKRMIREADNGCGYARVKMHERLMRYSFIRTDQQIWVKFFTNGPHRALVPAVKFERGSDLFAFFEDDVNKLEAISHD